MSTVFHLTALTIHWIASRFRIHIKARDEVESITGFESDHSIEIGDSLKELMSNREEGNKVSDLCNTMTVDQVMERWKKRAKSEAIADLFLYMETLSILRSQAETLRTRCGQGGGL